MTSRLEEIARIIDPSVFDGSIHTKHGIQFSEATVNLFRSDAMAKARAILALPEIVKMQEALEQCADRFAAFNKWQLNGRAGPVPQYEAAHTFARAALQPLKKEAE